MIDWTIILHREGVNFKETQHRQCRNRLFTPDKPGRFTFPAVFWHSDSMRNNTAFSWGVVKSSLQVWIWKYPCFKWGARLHLEGFGVFIFLYTIFEAFRTWKDVFAKPMENLMKNSKSARCFLPPPDSTCQNHLKIKLPLSKTYIWVNLLQECVYRSGVLNLYFLLGHKGPRRVRRQVPRTKINTTFQYVFCVYWSWPSSKHEGLMGCHFRTPMA